MSTYEDGYSIRRDSKENLIWNPPRYSREMRNALELKYLAIDGHEARLRQALKEFQEKEQSSRSQAQSSATRQAASAHNPSSQLNLSDSSFGKKKAKGGRKGPLSATGRKEFQENYGKVCSYHKRRKTKASRIGPHMPIFINTRSAIRTPASIGSMNSYSII